MKALRKLCLGLVLSALVSAPVLGQDAAEVKGAADPAQGQGYFGAADSLARWARLVPEPRGGAGPDRGTERR